MSGPLTIDKLLTGSTDRYPDGHLSETRMSMPWDNWGRQVETQLSRIRPSTVDNPLTPHELASSAPNGSAVWDIGLSRACALSSAVPM
jgi:hypothetical protein